MTHLEGRVLANPNSTLFEPLWQIQQLLACIMQAAGSIHVPSPPNPNGEAFVMLSKQFDKSAIMQMDGVIALAVNDRVPLSTWIDFYELSGFIMMDDENSFDRLHNLAISVVFVSFYQTHKNWLYENVSEHEACWPDVLQFARLVRNAMAHDGCICIKGKPSSGAKWHHLAYDKSDNDTRLIGRVLNSGDLLILLVEAAQKIDELLAPTRP